MKKLILINYAPPFTSIYKYTMEIASAFHGSVEIVHLRMSNRSGRWDSEIKGVLFGGISKNIFAVNLLLRKIGFRRAIKFIRERSDEETIIHYIHQNIRPLTVPDGRTVVTVHDNPETNLRFGVYSDDMGGLRERINFMIFSRSILKNYRMYSSFPNVLTNSNYVRKSLINFGFRGKISALYPPVGDHFKPLGNREELREKLGLPTNKILVLSVSSMHKRKNLDTVTKVMNDLGDDFALVRVGRSLGKDYSFRNVSPETINGIYNACDVMLIPSVEEGFGYPVAEALSVGLPVVASDIPVFEEAFGDAIITSNPFDYRKLANSIRYAVVNREELSSKALRKSREFSFETFRMKINSYYENIINGKSNPPVL